MMNDPPGGDQIGRLEQLVTAARRAGVADLRVLDAMRRVPRAAFVPPDQVELAYDDEPVPIPHRQVTTQPSLSARMLQALRLVKGEHVLEVGTGYGYQTALLAQLASFVTSIERWPDLAEQARRNLAAQKLTNVRVVDGDGTEGLPSAAPYGRHPRVGCIPTRSRAARQPAPVRRTPRAAHRIGRRRAGDGFRVRRGRPRVARRGVSGQVRAFVWPTWLPLTVGAATELTGGGTASHRRTPSRDVVHGDRSRGGLPDRRDPAHCGC